MIKTLVLPCILCFSLFSLEIRANTYQTKSLTISPHKIIINDLSPKSYKIDSTYDNDSVCFINKSNKNVIIRMNECMFFIIYPNKSGTFWKNGNLWVLGYNK